MNINSQNGMFLAGGILAYMFSNKLGPVKGIAKIGGLAAAALGAADVFGIFSINQLQGMIPSFGGYGAGSYGTNTLPYDANNYYIPR